MFRVCGRVVERKTEEDRIEKGYEIAGEVEGTLAAEHVRSAMARSLKRLGSDTSDLPKGKRQLAIRDVAATAGGPAASAGPSAASAGGAAAAGAGSLAAKAGEALDRAARRRQQVQRQKLSGLIFELRELMLEMQSVGIDRGHGLEEARETTPKLQGMMEELDNILLTDPAGFDAFVRDKGPFLALAQDELKRLRKSVKVAQKARAAAAAAGPSAASAGGAAAAGSGASAAAAGSGAAAAAAGAGAAAAGSGGATGGV